MKKCGRKPAINPAFGLFVRDCIINFFPILPASRQNYTVPFIYGSKRCKLQKKWKENKLSPLLSVTPLTDAQCTEFRSHLSCDLFFAAGKRCYLLVSKRLESPHVI